MGLALILYVLLVALVGTNGHKLSARDTNDYIKDLKRGVLVKNGELTSCELLPIDSQAAVVAASCLGYTKESIIDKDDIYTVYYDKGRDNIEGQYKVDNISVHSNFNPSNYVNDLAILQFNSDSKETWQSRLASYGGYEWDSLVYTRANPGNLKTTDWQYDSLVGRNFFDDTCISLSGMFETNQDNMVCSQNTTHLQVNTLNACNTPMGIAVGITKGKAFLIGPYSFTAIKGGNNMCNYDYQRSYYTAIGSFVAFIKDTIGRDLLIGDEFITEVRYDPDYKMIDHDFDNDIAATNVGGDFFKDQKDATNPSLATDSSSLDSLSSDLSTGFGNSDTDSESDDSPTSNDDGLGADKEDGNHGLTQREKAIIAACVSVGGAIVIGLILLIVWWRRWRDRDVADPMEQTLYQDAIENEIGGVSVPAYSPNSHALRNDSASELTADVFSPLPRGSDQVPNSVNIFRADLPPTYEDVAERRMDPLLTTTEKNDLKRDEE
ncbi:hypothetical protein EV181_002087 [Coemansia sp. RSA 532]|nr:hypothetical protein EV181_002087 [Coemansia sp. RSA 532]